ncbi:unnamed protein product [Periconia digitata]|uniref:peptidylprolyl isomerase n=1 Tax=Periconia digitata TaxID=1303443 RepID=A0A9W4UJS7_9PLEO|nr:unnamed protein product [Periconia digitata]
MSALVPAGVYGLRVPAGGIPVLGSQNPGLSFRITMAAIDPTAESLGDMPRSTLKILRERMDDEDGEDDDSDYDEDDVEGIRAKLREAGVLGSDDDSDMSEDDSEEETNGGPSDPVKSKQAKREALEKKLKEELEAEMMEIDSITVNGKSKHKGKGKAVDGDDEISSEEEDDDDSESDDEVQELVLCTLNPDTHSQQTLEITVREGEEVYFVAVGGYDIFLTGNYVVVDDEDDSEDDEDDEYGMGYGGDEDDLSEELSESEEDELDGLEDPRITEVDSEDEEAPKLVKSDKKGKKRPAEEEEDATLDDLISKTKNDAPATNGEKLSKKQAKKLKNNEGQAVAAAESKKEAKDKAEAPGSDKKKVQFAKNLEQGPTGSPKVQDAKKETPKGPRNVNGVVIDDKKDGKGRPAKKGDRIEMRYIGKLKNGKQFDANKKGKPFSFKLGVGEVIKGWDIGVLGMTAGSERRLTIPAKHAYGSKALPGIPANSELTFDIKCISVN